MEVRFGCGVFFTGLRTGGGVVPGDGQRVGYLPALQLGYEGGWIGKAASWVVVKQFIKGAAEL